MMVGQVTGVTKQLCLLSEASLSYMSYAFLDPFRIFQSSRMMDK